MSSKSSEHTRDWLTPEDCIKLPDIRPKADKLGWTRETIGMLYWAGLIEGEYNKKLRKCFICKDSVLELMRHANRITLKRLIDGLEE